MSASTVPSVAVIGCGHWGKNLVRNFSSLGALAAVCDQNPSLASTMADKYAVENLSFTDILAADNIAGIVIAAPAEQHAAMAREALLADKHVFVEKPIALDVADAETLCDLAEERDRILMVGHLLRYHPAFLAVHDLVREKRYGKLLYIYSNRLNFGRIRTEENILWSFAPHDLSMILELIGEEPETVMATGHCYLHKSIADVTTMHMKFSAGIGAHVHVSWLHPFKEQRLVIVCENGMIVFDDSLGWDQKITCYPHRVDWSDGVPSAAKADSEHVPLDEAEPLALECSHFLECVVSGTRPRTDGKDGLRVLKLLDAAEQSMRNGADSVPITTQRDDVFVHESAAVDQPSEIGGGTRIWHFSHVLKNSVIGKNCTIGQNVSIGPEVKIGDGCKIQNNVSVYKGVTLEDAVFCGPSAVFTNVMNPRAEVERKDEFRPTLVRAGASIGANATIVCGVEIGAYAFIGAGAVVLEDVAPHALMVGNPARQVGWMSRAGERLGDDLICPATGEVYVLSESRGLMRQSENN